MNDVNSDDNHYFYTSSTTSLLDENSIEKEKNIDYSEEFSNEFKSLPNTLNKLSEIENLTFYNETMSINDENQLIQQSDVDSDTLTTIKKNDYTRITRAKTNEHIFVNSDTHMSSHLSNLNYVIHIGENYQANVPEYKLIMKSSVSSESTISTIINRNDELLWDPKLCSNKKVEYYLRKISSMQHSSVLKLKKCDSKIIPDNEKALKHLLKYEGKIEKALKKQSCLNKILQYDNLLHMSKNDCILFEIAMLKYYKDFENIQKYYFPNKSVQQLIEYFYFWKKSSNYDAIKLQKCQLKNEILFSQDNFMSNTIDKLNLPYYKNNDGSYSCFNLIFSNYTMDYSN